MRHFNSLLCSAVLCLSFVAAPAVFAQDNAADPAEVMAKVGDVSITRGDLGIAENELGQQFARVPPAQREAAILNTLIDFHVMAQKAQDEGIESDAGFVSLMKLMRVRALHDTYFRKTTVDKLDPAEIQKIYDEQTAPLKGKQEVSARHILVKTQEDAMEVIELLNRGGDFAEIAKEKSTGPSAPQGGDLGFFGKGRMVPAFEAAAFALEAGDYTTEPVETQFGFHVILTEQKREAPVPTLDQVGGQIRQQLLQQRYVDLMKTLREDAKVEILTSQSAQ